jgi:acyl carrier protein
MGQDTLSYFFYVPFFANPLQTNFADLQMDSLDAVQVIVAVEKEFSIEIHDDDAARITTVAEAVECISKELCMSLDPSALQ